MNSTICGKLKPEAKRSRLDTLFQRRRIRQMAPLLLLWGIARLAIGENPAFAQSTVPPEVQFVVAQSRQSFLQTKDVTYKFKTVTHWLADNRHTEVVGDVKQRSELQYEAVDATSAFDVDKADPTATPDAYPKIRGFVGPASTGHWFVGSRTAMQFEYDRPGTMSDNAQSSLITFRSPHPELSAFGNGRKLLWDLLADADADPGEYRWELVKVSSDSKTIQLRMFEKYQDKWPADPTLEFTIDTSRGYCVSNVKEKMPYVPYPLIDEREVVVAPVEGNAGWYPTQVIEHYHGLKESTSPQFDNATTISDVNIHPQLADVDFSIASLKLPEGTGVNDNKPDGKRVSLQWKNGGLAATALAQDVPEDMTGSPIRAAEADSQTSRVMTPERIIGAGVIALIVGGVLFLLARSGRSRRRA